MIRAKGLRTWAAAAALLATTALPVGAQSLSDALVGAYNSSPLLAQQRNLLRVEDEDVAQAVATLRPTLSYFAQTQLVDNEAGDSPLDDGGTNRTTSFGIDLSWTLFDWGQRAFQIGGAKETVLATRWLLTDLEQDVLGQAVDAYLQLALAVRTVDVRESNLRLLQTQLQASRDRFEVGEVTRTDVAIAEAALAGAQSELAAARGQVDISRELYRQATGSLPGSSLSALPPSPSIPPTAEGAQALAVQIAPTIKALQHQIVGADLGVQVAEASRRPSVTLNGQIAETEGRGARGVTLRAGGPIYTGGSLASNVRQATARANALRAQLANEARTVTFQVGQAYAQLMVAKSQLMASEEQVRSAQLAFEGFREEALLGARTTLDVLDAEQQLLDARVARLQADTNVEGAVYDVLGAIGLLTTEHLGLSVERYDPDAYYQAVRTAPATLPRSDRGNRRDRVLKRFGRGG